MGEALDTKLVELSRKLFGDTPRLQVAALPWRVGINGPEIMLITSRDTGRWVLPKGWIESGEKPWRAAEREAQEEAGIAGDVSRKEAGRFLYAKVKFIGRATPCEVVVYALTVASVAERWKEAGERERRWFSPEQAAALVDEPGLTELILNFGKDPAAHAA